MSIKTWIERMISARQTTFVAVALGSVSLPWAVSAGIVTDWTGGTGGTESEPLAIYDKNNWSSGELPSRSYTLRFAVDAPTVLTNSAGIATSIADWVQFTSGEFTVLGDIQMSVLGWGQAAGTARVVKKGDWLVSNEFVLGYSAGSHFTLVNAGGDITRTYAGSPFDIARAADSTAIVENTSGDWNVTANQLNVGLGSNSRGELRFTSGNFSLSGTLNVGKASGSVGLVEFCGGGTMTFGDFVNVGTGGTGNLTIGPGQAKSEKFYIQLGHTTTGVMTVRRGGSYTKIGETDGASMWVSMENGASGTLNVAGGEVLLGGTLGFHYRGTSGTSAVNITDGGLLTCARLWQRSGSSAVNVLIDNGTLRAYASRSDFLPAASYLSVKVGAGGATFDSDGKDITIAANLNDADGAQGAVTFAGDGGVIRLTGELNVRGAVRVSEKTQLVAKDAAMKAKILERGLTLLRPKSSPKGTFVFFSVADGTPCTEEDLSRVTLDAGLSRARLFIANGGMAVELLSFEQTWSGESGVSAAWTDRQWDDGELFDDGNDARFATVEAIARLDADASVKKLTVEKDAAVTGDGMLNVSEVSVSSGVTATIGVATEGPLVKTGGGLLKLGKSRSDATTLSEGTLALTPGATLTGALTLGTDAAKPITLDFGGGAYAGLSKKAWTPVCDTTIKNGVYEIFQVNPNNGKTVRLGSNAVVTLTDYCGINGGAHLVIDGATVTNTWGYLQPGQNGVGAMSVVNGGSFTRLGEADGASLWLSMKGAGSGTLSVDGGRVTLGGALGVHYYGGSGATAVSVTGGGVLTMSRLYQRSGTSPLTLAIDNGTLSAFADADAFIPNKDFITVTVGAGGATIDSNGKRVTIAKAMTGVGGVLYKGGGCITLSAMPAVEGRMTVEVGTGLVIPSPVAGEKLAVTLPEALAPGVYEVVSISGEDRFAADVLSKMTVPATDGVRFILGGGGRAIYCHVGTLAHEQVWIGGIGGSLGEADNWLCRRVPTSGEAIVSTCAASRLLLGAGFTPETITFGASSAKVTIVGDRTLASVTKIVNRSAAAHEFACPVEGTAMSFDNESVSCVFSGGITLAEPSFVQTHSGRSSLRGTWRITATTWTPSAGWRVASDGNVTVDGQLLNPAQIGIDAGGVLAASSFKATNTTYPASENNGQLAVSGLMEIENGGSDFQFAPKSADASTVSVGGILFKTPKWPWLNAKTLVVGSDGIGVAENYSPELRFSNNATLCPRDGVLPLKANKRFFSIASGQNLTIDTTKYGTEDVPAVVNVEGKINVNVTDNYRGGIVVKGCGQVVFASQSTFIGGLRVTETATVAVKAGCTPGSGPVSVAPQAVLALTQSGTVTLGDKLTLEDGAALAFTFTEKAVSPVLAGTSLDLAGETVTVRVTAAEALTPRGGTYTLTSGMDFTGKTVRCDNPPAWVRAVDVVDGNIVLTVKSRETIVIIR